MTAIANALSTGYTPTQVLDFIINRFPRYQSKIKKAIAAGYSAPQILSYLEGSKAQGPQTEHERAISERKKQVRTAGATTAALAAAPFAAYAISRAAPQLAGSLFPTNPQGPAPTGSIPPVPGGSPQMPPAPSPTPVLPPTTPPNTPVPSPPASPAPIEAKVLPPIPLETLRNLGLTNQIEVLAKNNKIEDIPAILQATLSSDKKNALKGYDLKPAIEEHLKSKIAEVPQIPTEKPENIPEVASSPTLDKALKVMKEHNLKDLPVTTWYQKTFKVGYAEAHRMREEDVKTLSGRNNQESMGKGTVMLPNGDVGTLESEKDGIAKVDINGQEKHRKADELLQAPVNNEELGDIYDNLMSKIPEVEKSALINWSGYDPETQELIVLPHFGGKGYVFTNIPDEYVNDLRKVAFQAKTSGKKVEGAWIAGEASRGAGINKIMQDIKKKHPDKKAHAKEYVTVFDAFSLPREASYEKRKKKTGRKEDEKR